MPLTCRKCLCGKCYFGVASTDADAVGCLHNVTDILEYRIERPFHKGARVTQCYSNNPAQQCTCEGCYDITMHYPQNPCIEVDYKHFHCDAAPIPTPNDRVYTWNYFRPSDGAVWPPSASLPCCGYQGFSQDDADCINYGIRCSTTHRNWYGSAATPHQARAISDGSIPSLNSPPFEDCEFGNRYHFLQGIADRNPNHYFRDYRVNSSGSVVPNGYKKLEVTMLYLVYKEKWWTRYYNSLSQSQNPLATPTDNAASACRTPKYWIFACTGVPLFKWEVWDAHYVHGIITYQEMEDIFTGPKLPETAMDKLEEFGILKTQEFTGTDKIIKKSMSYALTQGGEEITEDSYFYGAPGGWDYVCNDFRSESGTSPEVFCIDDSWPQDIPRRFSITDGCSNTSGQCHTADPSPTNGGYCVDVRAYVGAQCGGICGYVPDLNECTIGVVAACGPNTGTTCLYDSVTGNCKGANFQAYAYTLDYVGPVGSTNAGYACLYVNHGTLCRVSPGGLCDYGELPQTGRHQIPTVISAAWRNGQVQVDLCCGGSGTKKDGTSVCPASIPTTDDCEGPEVWGEDLCPSVTPP